LRSAHNDLLSAPTRAVHEQKVVELVLRASGRELGQAVGRERTGSRTPICAALSWFVVGMKLDQIGKLFAQIAKLVDLDRVLRSAIGPGRVQLSPGGLRDPDCQQVNMRQPPLMLRLPRDLRAADERRSVEASSIKPLSQKVECVLWVRPLQLSGRKAIHKDGRDLARTFTGVGELEDLRETVNPIESRANGADRQVTGVAATVTPSQLASDFRDT